jgi:hypothetical protein
MTCPDHDVADIMIQVFAEYLRKWEARQKIFQDNPGAVMGGTLPHAIDGALGRDQSVENLCPTEDVPVDQRLDDLGQQDIAGDRHSDG